MKTDSITVSKIWSTLAGGKAGPQTIATRVMDKPALLPEVFAGLDERKARVKFGCAKVLLLVSEKTPKKVLPFWDQLAARLDNENKILQWSAILTMGNLAAVAPARQAQAVLPRLLGSVCGPIMITAANSMRSLTQFALAHPRLASPIIQTILRVEKSNYATEDCRDVALGHAIEMLNRLISLAKDRAPILAMVRRQLGNPRPATRKKAEAFLKKHAAK